MLDLCKRADGIKMKIKIALLFTLTVFLTFLTFAQKKNTVSLIGNWESESIVNSHLAIMKINSDSTFLIQNDLTADYLYRISGNRIIRTLLTKHPGKPIIDTAYFKLKKDSLIITFLQKEKDKIISMVRSKVKRSFGNSIVGSYAWKYPNGHTAFSKFTKDGKWFFRVPEQIVKGKYIIYEDKISFYYSDKPADYEKRMYFIKGNQLLLRDTRTGMQSYYKRVDYFPED